jgi:hypothetical protein
MKFPGNRFTVFESTIRWNNWLTTLAYEDYAHSNLTYVELGGRNALAIIAINNRIDGICSRQEAKLVRRPSNNIYLVTL